MKVFTDAKREFTCGKSKFHYMLNNMLDFFD